MFALLMLSLTLAQVMPYPSTAPNPAESIVRRPPVVFPAWPDAAVIENSGSTNTAGYRIAVRPSGEAAYTTGGNVERGTVSRATAHWLFAKLAAAGPLDALAVRHCMKSASFGSSTLLEWQGARSSDLSCGGDPTVAELNRTIGVILTQLRVSPGPRTRRLL
jgi:hypothetical protein